MNNAVLNGLKWAVNILIVILSLMGGIQLIFATNNEPSASQQAGVQERLSDRPARPSAMVH